MMNVRFKKILVIGIDKSKLDSEYWKRIDLLADKTVHLPKDSPEIRSHLSDTDCLLVNFGIKVGKDYIDSAPNLRYIGVLATAYGKIDSAYAKKRGIVVCNIPGYSTEAVAEFVFAAILDHARDLETGKKRAREGDYSGAGFSSVEIKDKIFGIIGLGRIGSRVAEIALCFGADVKYWSRNRKADLEGKGIKYEDVNSLIAKCDFLSLHLAQTQDTENFLNENMIQKIKNGAVVINTAPMELVNIGALEKRLEKGDMAFILDHSDEMKDDDLKKLQKYHNCIIYPPVAYLTNEARSAKQEIFVVNIENFIRGSPSNEVN